MARGDGAADQGRAKGDGEVSNVHLWKVKTAKREYRCDAGATCLMAETKVNPGDRYVDEIYPPWTLVQDDPDSKPTELGTWVHHRFHLECYGG